MLSELIEKLNEIRDLPDNWDGQGTAAPNSLAYLHATKVIETLSELNFIPNKLVPFADEGIGFYFSNKNKYGFIECHNTGEIIVAMSDRQGFQKVREISLDLKNEVEYLQLFIGLKQKSWIKIDTVKEILFWIILLIATILMLRPHC